VLITAVVTAYHPDELLRGVVEKALDACAGVIVVDNTPDQAQPGSGSGSAAAPRDPLGGLSDPRVTLLASGRNLGLAAGLNTGLAALPEDTEAVLLLDQDSMIPDGMIDGLAAILEKDGSVGVVGPSPVDPETGVPYETMPGRHETVADRDIVITSGMLLRRECLKVVPEFREDFFVDYVDVDFCLRLRAGGVRIVRDLSLPLPHSIGDVRAHRFLGRQVKVGHQAAWRHYWNTRNGVILIREHLRRNPVWAVANALFLCRWFVHILLFEPQRGTDAPAYLRGLRDGLTRRVARRYIPSGAEYHGAEGAR
jgi:rhamnosyltransferase